MQFEPDVDRGALLSSLRDAYAIDADELMFVPVGYVAACYVVRTKGVPTHFAKMLPDTAIGRSSASVLERTLRLTEELQSQLTCRLPVPIHTTLGERSTEHDHLPVALFPFLAGSAPRNWPNCSPETWAELGRALAGIHSASVSDVRREPLNIPFETAVREGLRRAPQLVDGRVDEVTRQMDHLAELAERIRRHDSPTVLVHTDFGGDNILIDDGGSLAVLDWDDACCAPPEHDLRIGVEPDDHDILGAFLDAYRSAGGAADVHLDRFAFFLLRRALEDFAARFLRLLEEDPAEAEIPELVEGMQRWGFDEWNLLDDRLVRIERALSD